MKKGLIFVLVTIIVILGGYIIIDKVYDGDINNIFNKHEEKEIEEKKDESSSIKDDFIISYKEEKYEVEKIVSTRNLPIIVSKNYQDIATKIQESLTDISNQEWKNIKDSEDEYKNVLEDNLGIKYLVDESKRTNKYISFKFTEEGTFGGVSWDSIKVYNYSFKNGEVLKLSDIVSNYDKFMSEVVKLVKNKLSEENIDVSEDVIKSEIVKDGNWSIDSNELIFYFDKYSIASGAAGVVNISVSFDEIGNYIEKDYKN